MIELKKYLHPITMERFGGSPIESCELYWMDALPPDAGKPIPKLDESVGFSSFSCCDFFQFKNGVIFLIEASQVLDIDITKKFPHIPWKKFNRKNNFSQKNIQNIKTNVFRDHLAKKYLRKMLGSMAMLSRVAVKCDEPEFQKLHIDDELPKYNFYLAIHLPPPGEPGSRDVMALDNMKKNINLRLKDALDASKELILEVDVIIGSQLAKEMHKAGFA